MLVTYDSTRKLYDSHQEQLKLNLGLWGFAQLKGDPSRWSPAAQVPWFHTGSGQSPDTGTLWNLTVPADWHQLQLTKDLQSLWKIIKVLFSFQHRNWDHWDHWDRFEWNSVRLLLRAVAGDPGPLLGPCNDTWQLEGRPGRPRSC